MTDTLPAGRDLPPEEARARWIWRTRHQLDLLHSELASLYRTNSNNRKVIALLWRKIEEKEALLILEGVDVT